MDARALLLALVLGGCFDSFGLPISVSEREETPDYACEPAEIPEWLIGEFAIVGMGRSCLARDELELYADSCGEGGWWFYDIDYGGGGEGEFVRVSDDHWELQVPSDAGHVEVAISIYREGWLWHEREMLRIDASGIGFLDELWAIQARNSTPVEHSVEGTFCATEESWSVHTTSVAPEEAWGDSPIRLSDTRDGLVVRFRADEVLVADGRLPTCGHDCTRTSNGAVVGWDGFGGTIRYRNTHGLCSALSGDAHFTYDGNELVLEQDWVVIDVTDMDRDGLVDDRVIRRTRSVLREDACP